MKCDNIYFKLNGNNALCSGISFKSFITALKNPLKNILIVKSEYIGESNYKGFEIIEGEERVRLFSQEFDYQYGDFCFVDFSNSDKLELSDNDIAELLFFSHTERILGSTFFDRLNNRFLYLSHDNDFYCNFFCNDLQDAVDLLCISIFNRIQSHCTFNMPPIPYSIEKQIKSMAEEGIYIDCSGIELSKEACSVPLYAIGAVADMDEIHKYLHMEKLQGKLTFKQSRWEIVKSNDPLSPYPG